MKDKQDQKSTNVAEKKALTLVPAGSLATRLRVICSAIDQANKAERDIDIIWLVNEDFPTPSDRLFTISPTYINEGVTVTIRQSNWRDTLINTPPSRRNLFITWPFMVFRYQRYFSLRSRELPKDFDLNFERLLGRKRESILISSDVPMGPSSSKMYTALEATVEVNNVLRSRMSGWTGNVVGVHINRNVPEGNIDDCPTELFIRRMQKMIEEDPTVCFFITTNSSDEKERLATLFRERVFMTYSTQEPNSQKGIIEEFGELLALSRTRKILSTMASPSAQVAAEIGDIRLETLSVFTQNSIYR
ncbi:MAG: hypothetical protein Q4D93_02715 [Porphyromonas sp.]|nr:hypothetical protein [Porphyromonas sp.]